METGKIYKVELTKLRKLEHAGFWPVSDGASQIDFPCTLEKLNGSHYRIKSKGGQKRNEITKTGNFWTTTPKLEVGSIK